MALKVLLLQFSCMGITSVGMDKNQEKSFHEFTRNIMTLRSIKVDKSLNLTEVQKKEVKREIKIT